jgi:hypothetical protein
MTSDCILHQVSRELPRTLQAELDDVRTDPALARQGAAEERYGLATPKESAVSEGEGLDEVEDDGYLEQARGARKGFTSGKRR